MRFLFVFLVMVYLLGSHGMMIDDAFNTQNTGEEATVKNNTDDLKWILPERSTDDSQRAVTTTPDVLVPTTELEAQEDATTLQPLERAQDTLKGGNENASLSNVTAIRTNRNHGFLRNPPKYFYEVLGFIVVVSACVYGVALFFKMVEYLEAEQARIRREQAQPLVAPPQVPLTFKDLVKREDYHRCSRSP